MTDRPPIRLALDEAAFRDLVAGKVVHAVGQRPFVETFSVELILSDIGWGRMIAAVRDAMEGKSG